MNIGILTFHWATNYGAVLQCYALQSYLTSIGHNVKVINYKPRQYDESLYKFLRYRKFLRFEEYRDARNKEKSLIPFRDSHLNQTDRAYTCASVSGMVSQFDVIISGSDQVTNPSFLMSGEGKSIVSPTYFLGFPFEGKRIGYALSFGCVTYPDEARKVASKYIGAFDRISVREASGIDIVKSMGRDDAEVVPDPTLLMEPQFYHSLAGECKPHKQEPYIYSFFIRYIADRKNVINKVLE
ncbi:MAG: polysaccharide pyruvyl transferase family protein, partial [Bacteroides thetaiotaomicron]|nr:polysaccharide pyruvyl transferase family protein [Bacteroides thetaiotaomicron]